MPTHYGDADVKRLIEELTVRIEAAFDPSQEITLVGIRTRGEVLAQRITAALSSRNFTRIARGVLDITLYRDDLSEIGPKPMVRPTRIDADINGRPLLLVDDVLFTGRSVRAGLDALSDFGRPSVIRLAVLVDRGGRELPIQADFVGLTLKDVPLDHRVNVRLNEVDGRDEIVVEPSK
jgi:pyrimidine operon attenuation protein / uracil phosphoribosyltransferase